jgi:translation initiation factor eIF-2B subunit epsilon
MVEIDAADTLQALIIADSFSAAFAPLTASLSQALLPLANIPLIDYSIEFLVRNKVKEVIVVCTELTEAVEAHVNKVRVKGCKVRCFADDSCKCVGDVLRKLDEEQLLKNDFVLVQGALVSNVDLRQCLLQHRERRKKDADYVLTKVFKSMPVVSRLRTPKDQLSIALIDDRIVQYDDLETSPKFHYQGDYFKPINIRCDLMDTGMAICSVELLSKFTDNFDFKTLDQVVEELLTNELYTDKIAAYVVAPHCYIARAQDPRTYDAITKDVLARWAHPIVLNSNLLPYNAAPSYKCQHSDLYQEDNVQVAYSATVAPPSAIGARTTVADRSLVKRSVLGRDCRLGEDVKVDGAYLWDQVCLESGVTVEQAIIGTGCIIGTGSFIAKGCILDIGVILPENTILEPNTRLARKPSPDVANPIKLGNAYILPSDPLVLQEQSIGGALRNWSETDENWDTSSSGSSEHTDDSDDIYDEKGKKIKHKNAAQGKAFVDEVKDLVIEAMAAEEDADALLLSINNLKYTQNRSIGECIAGIVKGLFAQTPSNLAALLSKWKDLLQRYMMGTEEQLLLIREIETAVGLIALRRRFHVILSEMYRLEIVEGRSIIVWAVESQDEELKALAGQLVEFLKAEEEEGSEDEA